MTTGPESFSGETPSAASDREFFDSQKPDIVIKGDNGRKSKINDFGFGQGEVNQSEANSIKNEPTNVESVRNWYSYAAEVAAEHIASSNLPYSVKVVDVIVEHSNGHTTTGPVLRFSHDQDESLSWTMSVGADESYFSGKFQSVVEAIAARKINGDVEESESLDDTQEVIDVEQIDIDKKREEIDEKLEEAEKEKTEEEYRLIELVNEKINEIRTELQIPLFEVNARDIRLIKRDLWWSEASAIFYEANDDTGINTIAVRETDHPIVFFKKVVHESLHANIDNHILPTALNEALVESTTVHIVNRALDENFLGSKLETKDVRKQVSDAVTAEGESLFSEDTYFATVDSNGSVVSENFTYSIERETLNKLFETIVTKDKTGRFSELETVRGEFLRAVFTRDSKVLNFVDDILGQGALDSLINAKSVSEVSDLLDNYSA